MKVPWQVTSYTLNDGTVREIHDVWFDNDPMHSYYAYGQDVVLHEDVAGLPDLAGYGVVKDLRFAMSEDEDLRNMMRDLVLDAPSLNAALAGRFALPPRNPLARLHRIRLIRSLFVKASLNEPVTGRRSFTVDKINPGGGRHLAGMGGDVVCFCARDVSAGDCAGEMREAARPSDAGMRTL